MVPRTLQGILRATSSFDKQGWGDSEEVPNLVRGQPMSGRALKGPTCPATEPGLVAASLFPADTS